VKNKTHKPISRHPHTITSRCCRWRLKVNVEKSKVMVFRKGGRLGSQLQFTYDNSLFDIVSKYTYLGIVVTTGGSFSETQPTLAAQSSKAILTLEKMYTYCVGIAPSHKCSLFDKLVVPILCYCCEVWGFHQAAAIERVHLGFC
jgi:hypothetical protein